MIHILPKKNMKDLYYYLIWNVNDGNMLIVDKILDCGDGQYIKNRTTCYNNKNETTKMTKTTTTTTPSTTTTMSYKCNPKNEWKHVPVHHRGVVVELVVELVVEVEKDNNKVKVNKEEGIYDWLVSMMLSSISSLSFGYDDIDYKKQPLSKVSFQVPLLLLLLLLLAGDDDDDDDDDDENESERRKRGDMKEYTTALTLLRMQSSNAFAFSLIMQNKI